ncbi:2,4-dihydroxyhept-2-ene-1,7-dioic acid aldolase [Mucilaginibacter mali]|uniref:2,4-dihydroxyhept-2-ene-1,7-dioic acid aldolase n=1 Tax=Mucilaginibacter mali TaxID=2740462 RepID=A0A7D4Q9P2_9SPHI|nr:aldolase/citrate lyase family protein [Mucilaginibacter mali]QKJ31471.1 2,4-dihydroxyhept-2-ene-1,7-dioic acid aldolase [Mucilaginibacter mali]
MKNTLLKDKLRKRENTIGSWITIGHQAVVDILAEAGFDWLCIDLEHTAIDLNEAQVLIGFIQARNMAALVRVSKNEEVVIKRVLDSGADGIIIPMTCTADDAKKAVEYAKYPPIGKRGVGLNRAQRYGFNFEGYKDWVENGQVIIAQIEHIEGVNNLEAIVNTPGIDAVFIGPYDLSGSLGIPGQYNDPQVIEALNRVEKICQTNQISMGYHVIEPNIDLVTEKMRSGYNLIAFSTDFLFMGRNAYNEMSKLK